MVMVPVILQLLELALCCRSEVERMILQLAHIECTRGDGFVCDGIQAAPVKAAFVDTAATARAVDMD
jgi:hypothetical protein